MKKTVKKKKKSPKAVPLQPTSSEVLLGWLYLGIEFLILPTAIYAVGDAFGGFSAAAANAIYYIVNAVSCCVIFRRLLRQSLLNAGANVKNLLLAVVVGFVCYYAASTAVGLLIGWLRPDFANANDAAVADMLAQLPVLMPICVVALVPIAEECLFRGLIFLPLARRNPALGYVGSALAFAAIHVVGYLSVYDTPTLILCFLQYIPAGLCLSWACRKSDSLFAPILIHAAVNLLSALLVR